MLGVVLGLSGINVLETEDKLLQTKTSSQRIASLPHDHRGTWTQRHSDRWTGGFHPSVLFSSHYQARMPQVLTRYTPIAGISCMPHSGNCSTCFSTHSGPVEMMTWSQVKGGGPSILQSPPMTRIRLHPPLSLPLPLPRLDAQYRNLTNTARTC